MSRPGNFCRSCGRDFAGVRAFDAHRTGTHAFTLSEGLRMEPPRENGRRCLHDEELAGRGLELDGNGRWRIAADALRVRRHFRDASDGQERPKAPGEGRGQGRSHGPRRRGGRYVTDAGPA